jgi:hypothetical protein
VSVKSGIETVWDCVNGADDGMLGAVGPTTGVGVATADAVGTGIMNVGAALGTVVATESEDEPPPPHPAMATLDVTSTNHAMRANTWQWYVLGHISDKLVLPYS